MTDVTQRLGGVLSSLAFKAPCRVATTANITLAGLQTIDGVALTAADSNLRVLVKNQTVQTANGIYLAESGNWQRDRDFDGNHDFVKGTRVYVHGGAVGATSYVVTTADPIVIGTSNIVFVTEQSLIGAGVGFDFDGGGAPIPVSMKAWRRMPFPGTITKNTMMADQAGTISVRINKDTIGNFPPTAADSIVASAPPTLTAAIESEDSTLTGWTTSFALGDVLLAEIISTSGVIQHLVLDLLLDRSD